MELAIWIQHCFVMALHGLVRESIKGAAEGELLAESLHFREKMAAADRQLHLVVRAQIFAKMADCFLVGESRHTKAPDSQNLAALGAI